MHSHSQAGAAFCTVGDVNPQAVLIAVPLAPVVETLIVQLVLRGISLSDV